MGGGVEHILDNRLTSLMTQNTFEFINNLGMSVVVDSGRYNDVTINPTTLLPDYTQSQHLEWPDGVPSASRDILHLESEFTTHIHENLNIGDDDFTLPFDKQRVSKRDTFSEDNFQFLNGSLEPILDGGFENSAITSNGLDLNYSNDYPQLKDFVSGRVALYESHVNQYNNDGSKHDKLKTYGEEVIVTDESLYKLENIKIKAIDYFGGDYLQMSDGKIVPTVEAVKLLNVDVLSSQNAFLNLHAKVTKEASFTYDSATSRLTVAFSSQTPDMYLNFAQYDEVWVGRFIANDSDQNLVISSNYIWEVEESEFNYVVLNVPAGEVDLINPVDGVVSGVEGTILMSSMNMTSLMYYYNNL